MNAAVRLPMVTGRYWSRPLVAWPTDRLADRARATPNVIPPEPRSHGVLPRSPVSRWSKTDHRIAMREEADRERPRQARPSATDGGSSKGRHSIGSTSVVSAAHAAARHGGG